MIAGIRGIIDLVDATAGEVVVRAGHLMYRVKVGGRAASMIGEAGDEITLYVSVRLRGEEFQLTGFRSYEELKAFEMMLGARGVGPALALSLIDTLGLDGLFSAVKERDVAALSQVPGVGEKTAARILSELAGKLPEGSQEYRSVMEGLINLGYNRSEARSAVAELPKGLTEEEALRRALRLLAATCARPMRITGGEGDGARP